VSYQVDYEVGRFHQSQTNSWKNPQKLFSGRASRWAGDRASVPKGERFTLADAYGSVWAFSIYQSGRPSNSRSVCFSPFIIFGFFLKKNPLLLDDGAGRKWKAFPLFSTK
jgi:hypothetical protein